MRNTDVPEYDETVECTNPLCVHAGAEPMTGLHGMLGGGMGPYTVCSMCGQLLTKSQDSELLCDSHEVEIKDGNESDKAASTDGESGGSVPSPRK
jgi:hypothetical protein